MPENVNIGKWALVSVVGLMVFFLLMVLVGGGCREYNRYQRRADAKNKVTVTKTEIQSARQRVEVETQEARVRVAEARGIKQAQRIINATLTPQYLQHEAIGAQLKMAGGPNHTQIYIPTGDNGIPLVRNLGVGDGDGK